MADWIFNPGDYQEKTFQVIPVGDYRARIEDVEEKTFSSGNSGYEITLEINGYNSKVWFYLVLDPSNVAKTNQKIGDFFNSFGITSTAMGTGKQWIGAVGAVRIRHDEYNGQTNAKVAYCINRSRQDSLPTWKNAPAPATPTYQAPTWNAVPQVDELPFN